MCGTSAGGEVNDYPTIPAVDVALGRAAMRIALYRAAGAAVSVLVMGAVIDRLLDRRSALMKVRDGV